MKTRLRYPLLCGTMLGLSSTFSLPALATTDAMLDLLEVLRDKGTISDSDYQDIRKAAQTDEEQIRKNVEEATRNTVKIETGGSGLKVGTDDGEFKFQVGGRAMMDAAYTDEDSTRLGNGAELRRARLFAAGTMYRDWFYKAQLDFAGDSVAVKDFYMGYQGFKPVKITFGNHKEPFSLEELTSSKYITFMERALPNAFAPSRNTGVSASTHGAKWGASAGYFFDGVKNESAPKSQGWGLTGRAHFAPIAEKDRVIHLGAGAGYRGSDGANELRFRERPESHITSTRLVDTGTLPDYENMTLYNLESAMVYGPFSLQGEYMRVAVEQGATGSDPDFSGWYVFGSYFITGEHRPYKASSGTFGRVRPGSIVGRGGHGAWELAARYSTIDLSDSGIDGGEENNITVGLNWYATPNIRFMANYIRASTDPTSVAKFPAAGDEDVNIFQVRSQIDF